MAITDHATNGSPSDHTALTHASARRLTPGVACSLLGLALLILGSHALTRDGLSLLQGLTALWSAPQFDQTANLSQANSALLSAQLVAHVSWWPRMICALLAGGALGMAGVLMQQVLRNPLAAPTTLGVASGASLAMMLATLFAPALMTGTGVAENGMADGGFQLGREWVALIGGMVAMGLVFALAWARGMTPTIVVLAGLVINLYIGALGMVLLLFNQEALHGTLVWGAGSLAQNSWDGVITLVTRLVPGMLLALLLMRPLAVLDLDEANARSLGVSLRKLRLLSLGLAVFLSACVVSVLGIIGFIGLAAPACVRLMGARRLGQRLLWAPLFGALLLAVTDLVVASLDGLLPNLIPTGAMTAALGAPLLLWLIPRLKMTQGAGPISGGLSLVRRHPQPTRLHALLAIGVLLALLLALISGNTAEGWTLDGAWLHGNVSILDWRLPRVLAAAGAGILLALSGTLLQRLTNNPMASPEILGISGGTAIALMLTLLLVPGASQLTLLGAGVGGAALCLILLVLLNHRSGFIPERVLLCGVAITALYEAVRGIILADGDPRGQQILAWLSGSTYYVGLSAAVTVLALAIISVLMLRPLARWLDILPLGAASASALGIGVLRARLSLLGIVALLTALATLIVGPLSFVGLLAPHLARLLGLSRARDHMLGAVLCGALLMVLADWLGRQLLFPYEIPAGLMASLIGGSYFLWSLRKPS